MNAEHRIYAYSLISALLYSIWGMLVLMTIRAGLSPGSSGLLVYSFASALVLASGGSVEGPRAEWVASGIIYASANLTLFYIMTLTYLSSAYIFVPSSILVFYFLSLRGSSIRRSEALRSSLGIITIVAGLCLSQMEGLAGIDLRSLALGLIAAMLYGIASYLTMVSVSPGREVSESFWILLSELLVFLPASLAEGLRLSGGPLVYAAAAGASVGLGLVLELHSYRLSEGSSSRFKLINIVNVLTNMDTVLIAIASVIIGSYTAFGVIGLLLVFAGASVFYR